MPGRERPIGRYELLLAGTLAIEIAVFASLSPQFASIANLVEISRFSVELGLLAIAATPVIVTGGIDLSAGALLGLSAVVVGAASIDWRWPAGASIAAGLAVGAAGGWLNGRFIARSGLPPLIVTLGSLALFRGLAEAITEGARSYSGFPHSLLAIGQGYLGRIVPAQIPLLLAAIAGYALLLHRSLIGRAWYAIGLNREGARYAGLPIERRLMLAYLLSGVMAGLAAVVYVAHLGQARADAGAGYELNAITAVILGGASIAGGRGTIWGTLLGLLLIAVLQNGLQMAALPSELSGVLTGALLVATIAVDRVRRRAVPNPIPSPDEVPVRNTQVALICAAVLTSGLLVAGTNIWLVRSVAGRPEAPGAAAAPASTARAGHRITIAMLPKAKGDPYFVSCRAGAEEAARELNVDLLWDGPTGLDAARQNEFVENWITRQVDAIAVSVENRASISTVLRKARARGIKVLTWDADAEPDARDFFVNQATADGIGATLTDEASRLMNGRGSFAIVTGALSAANQNAWIAAIRARLGEKYPGLRLALIRPSDDDRDKAFAETQTILQSHPEVSLVMAISAPALPGAAEAVRQSGRRDVRVIGLSLPNINKPYVHDGSVQTVVLWNTGNLGYLTVTAAALAAANQIPQGTHTITAGRLGQIEVRGSEIILGPPLVMTKENIDQYNF